MGTRSLMRMTGALLALLGASTHAHAQTQPPKSVWTKFNTSAPHTTVASIACALDASAVIDGVTRPLSLDAMEDARQICFGKDSPGAVRGRVRMTADPSRNPSEIVVELAVAQPSSATTLAALQSVLVNMSADLDRRSNAQSWTPPPTVIDRRARAMPAGPMHPVTVTNVPLIAAGASAFGASYFISLLVGAAVVGAAGDPGTGRFWPFVPFMGLVAFSTTYKEAANCDCSAGRVFSIVGSVVLDAAQIAGVALFVVGLVKPRTKMVPDTISLRIGPTGAALGGTF